jgi:hypothetical protein
VKRPDAAAQARINQALLAVFIELDVDPNEVESMTIDPQGLTFTTSVTMRVAVIP